MSITWITFVPGTIKVKVQESHLHIYMLLKGQGKGTYFKVCYLYHIQLTSYCRMLNVREHLIWRFWYV